MVKNMGNLDRIARVGVAALLIIGVIVAWPLTLLAVIFAILAVILLVTAILGTCPIYMLFHFSTKKE